MQFSSDAFKAIGDFDLDWLLIGQKKAFLENYQVSHTVGFIVNNNVKNSVSYGARNLCLFSYVCVK